jgi:hypothetical protein
MNSTRKNARVAGFFYLLLVLIGPLRLIYIPSTLFVHGNATATASNIAAHELLFRFGMVSDLVGATIMLFVTLALYRLLKGVDHDLAVLMVILGGLMVTPIYFVNTLNDAAALLLARGADFLSAFSFTALLFPQYEGTVFNIASPIMLGEVAIMLWLLIMGARDASAGVRAVA